MPKAVGKEDGRVSDFPRELCKITEISTHTQPPEHSGPDCFIFSHGNLAASEEGGRDAGKKFRLMITILLIDGKKTYCKVSKQCISLRSYFVISLTSKYFILHVDKVRFGDLYGFGRFL